jgi:hypothetical protein
MRAFAQSDEKLFAETVFTREDTEKAEGAEEAAL